MNHFSDIVDLGDLEGPSPAASELQDRWSHESRALLQLSRQQWHHPATHELLVAIERRDDLRVALARLGEARADAGLSLTETLTDLEVLDRLLPLVRGRVDTVDSPARLDSLAAADHIGTAWAETFYAGTTTTSCIDELTGLVTAPYLEARLEQIYRHCSYLDLLPGDAHALVVVQLSRCDPSPFTRVAHRLRLAGDLRVSFPGSDTLAVLEPTGTTQCMVALTSAGPGLDEAVAALGVGAGNRHVWVEALPAALPEALAFLRALPESCPGD